MARIAGSLAGLLLATPLWLAAQEAAPGHVELSVTPLQARIGDRLAANLIVDLPTGWRLEPEPIAPRLGPFDVDGGAWQGPEDVDAGQRWSWSGSLTAFRTGKLELPSLQLRATGPQGALALSTEPLVVSIRSVLTEEEREQGGGELADLKPPASLVADYRALGAALAVLAALLLGSGLLWWFHRRYASRLAAVEVPDDPFHRTPPHVWVYAELQRLLERRLPEQGEVDRFYGELSRLLKRYLGGRFRTALMEQTSTDVPELLGQAGASADTLRRVEAILGQCDQVKFAQRQPEPAAWRAAVEQIYRIVDTTKPTEFGSGSAEKGAA